MQPQASLVRSAARLDNLVHGPEEGDMRRVFGQVIVAVVVLTVCAAWAHAADSGKMTYLVIGKEGPGFSSPAHMLDVLEKTILPTFDALLKLEKEGKILAGGLPLGDRAFVFIMEASSHNEVDELIRDLPAWGALKWKVRPLQSFKARADKERSVVKKLRSKQD